MSRLISWLADPHPQRGVRFAADGGDWEFVSYRELASSARRMATEMVSAGVRPGDVVCLLMPSGRDCLAALFGTWAAGATISPLLPPSFQSDNEYTEYVSGILRQAEPALVVTAETYRPLAAEAMVRAGRSDEPWIPREGATEIPIEDHDREGIALLQFTSGSTGQPRGVRVSWDNLAANHAMLSRLLDWRDSDSVVSWLPLHHDMGLIGCCLFPFAAQGELWLMRPEQFIRDPARWLECLAPGKATHSAAPSFAFAYAARRVKPQRLAELDLSSWRSVVVGAEVVDPAALDAFARFAEPVGFSRDTYLPSYGLAENTLAVTGAEGPVVVVRPDWSSMRLGEPVRIQEAGKLGDRPIEPGSGWLVGHGAPHEADGVGVRILDAEGRPLPDGHLGEVAVTGSSVAQGYHGGREGGSTRFVDDELRTGDAGFAHDGQLFVLGRMGDSLKLRGRSVYMDDLDAKVAAAARLDKDRIAVVAVNDRGRVGLAVFVESAPGPWTDAVTETLRGELGPEPSLTLVAGRRGLLKRTTSGKLRRRHMWQLLQEDKLKSVTVIN
ncbi:AMP-binding protein [Streptomyces sp. RPT161]|uniref:AMP-binding protein n=1 Tax=Streptomyces sp. RPT161 TaxID=3015993 RepID=UPI0022B93A33|nr:AMP-binding protein [Streptomyces sp. RPT161]